MRWRRTASSTWTCRRPRRGYGLHCRRRAHLLPLPACGERVGVRRRVHESEPALFRGGRKCATRPALRLAERGPPPPAPLWPPPPPPARGGEGRPPGDTNI